MWNVRTKEVDITSCRSFLNKKIFTHDPRSRNKHFWIDNFWQTFITKLEKKPHKGESGLLKFVNFTLQWLGSVLPPRQALHVLFLQTQYLVLLKKLQHWEHEARYVDSSLPNIVALAGKSFFADVRDAKTGIPVSSLNRQFIFLMQSSRSSLTTLSSERSFVAAKRQVEYVAGCDFQDLSLYIVT